MRFLKPVQCAEEVKYYVSDFAASRIIPAIDGGITKSDDCVDPLLQKELRKAASALRGKKAGAESPTSQVKDVVDPSLFPFAFEKTKVLRYGPTALSDCILRCGEGEAVKMPPEGDGRQSDPIKYPNDMAWSRRFQWLPFDVQFKDGGQGASRIKSYINNVHPVHHRTLYNVTESLIDYFIPLFNRTLIDLKAPGYRNQRMHLAMIDRDPLIQREPGPFRPPEQSGRHISRYLDEHGRYESSILVDLKKEFWNSGVQMILQMRDVELNVENPKYQGEPWHVQGQCNERICATAYYIYSTSNLSAENPPTMSFRCRIHPEESGLADAEIREPPYAPEMYGAKDGDPVLQEMGTLTLRQGRLIVSPNTFQIKLNAFIPEDKARPAHCKILMLHLLDPNRRAMSTSLVPCQRRDWWAEEVRKRCTRFRRLPVELWDRIVEMVDGWPIGPEEAERLRGEFVEEREGFRERHTKAMVEYAEWDFGDYE